MSAIRDFTVALEEWQEANRAYHKAREDYDGYSPDYHLSAEIAAMNRATEAMQKAFTKAVRESVRAIIAEVK